MPSVQAGDSLSFQDGIQFELRDGADVLIFHSDKYPDFQDLLSFIQGQAPKFGNSLAFYDAVRIIVQYLISASDSLSFSDSQTLSFNPYDLFSSDSLSFSDSQSISLGIELKISAGDSLSFLDSSGSLFFSGNYPYLDYLRNYLNDLVRGEKMNE